MDQVHRLGFMDHVTLHFGEARVMRHAEVINLAYFVSFIMLSLVWTLPIRARVKALLIGIGGLTLTEIAANSQSAILRDWLPVPLVAMAYWQSGCFFRGANPRMQAAFENSERKIWKLFSLDLAKCARTFLGTLVELAYVFCYPVVPLGLGALYLAGLRDKADVYWTVVLLSAYPCYALLPFVQLLPPRLVERTDKSTQSRRGLRHFNLWLVRNVTHEANTFPSGHVAASAAIALELLYF